MLVKGATGLAENLNLNQTRRQNRTTLERFRNPTITDTITVNEQPYVTSSLSVFVNANPVESWFKKRVRLVQFLGELLEFKLN